MNVLFGVHHVQAFRSTVLPLLAPLREAGGSSIVLALGNESTGLRSACGAVGVPVVDEQGRSLARGPTKPGPGGDGGALDAPPTRHGRGVLRSRA